MWSPEGKFNKNKFFLIPSLILNLPDDWQNTFAGLNNVKCLTLCLSKDEIDLVRELSRRNRQSISATIRKAVDSYFENRSWEVSVLPQAILNKRFCRQLSVYPLQEQISKLKYLSSLTNRPVTHLVTEAIRRYYT
jgi:hypothetical protein